MALNRVKVSQAADKFARQGKFQEAIREYQRLLDEAPQDVITLNKIGDLHRKAGHPERALTCYTRIADHYRDRGFTQKAIAMYKKVAKLAPEDAGVRQQLASLYADAGLSREAQENLRDAARLYAAAGESDRALELESRALELGPDDWAGLKAQAERLCQAGESERGVATYQRAAEGFAAAGGLEEALDCCRAAMAVAPLDPTPASTLTRLLLEADRADDAARELKACVKKDPKADHLQALLGQALLAAGDRTGARAALESARHSAFAAGDVRVHAALVRLDLAEGAVEGAVSTLERVLGAMEEQGAGGLARELLRECLERQPDCDQARTLLLESCKAADHGAEGVEESLDLLVGLLQEGEAAALPDALRLLIRYRPHDDALAARMAGQGVESPAVEARQGALATGGPLMDLTGEDGSQVDAAFVNEHLTEADVFIKYGLLAKAAEQLERIVERFPRTVVAHQRLADLHREQGNARGAIRHLAWLAEALRQQGAVEDAQRALADALGLEPENASLQEMRRALRQGGPLPAYRPGGGEHAPAAAELRAPSPPRSRPAAAAPAAPEPRAAPAPQAPGPAPEDVVAEEEVIELLDGEETAPPPPSPPSRPPAPGAAAPAAPAAQAAGPEGDQDDGFFDLAGAIEEELAREEASTPELPVVEDDEDEVDPVTGIRQAIQQQVEAEDHQTHYQLGIAFKEMGMLDEAIGEFQQASRHRENFLACCSMLGLCFREKGMPQIAEKWYRRGLEQARDGGDEADHRMGLLYDLGELCLELGRLAEAEQLLSEVYGQDAAYRDVAVRLREVGERRDGGEGSTEARG